MAGAVFEGFFNSVAASPAVALKRFASLQSQGDSDEIQVLRRLRQHLASVAQPTVPTLENALQLLVSLDLRPCLDVVRQPALHLLGEDDQLVPAAVADDLQQLNPDHEVQILSGAGHALPVSQPDQVATALLTFLQRQGLSECRQLKKQRVAESFSRSAATYDSVADLQKTVGAQLLERFPEAFSPSVLVDLGAGTGYFTDRLQRRFPDRFVSGLDLAQGMAAFANNQYAEPDFICGDAESLPYRDGSIDCLFSSLAIQWCEDLEAVFAEAHRVLASGGCFLFATVGPKTLYEMREAWSQVDSYTHVNRFIPEVRVRQAITAAGFASYSLDTRMLVREYAELRQLTNELKQLGAHNVNAGQSAGLTGKQRLLRFREAYEQFRSDDGLLPATWELYYGVLRRN